MGPLYRMYHGRNIFLIFPNGYPELCHVPAIYQGVSLRACAVLRQLHSDYARDPRLNDDHLATKTDIAVKKCQRLCLLSRPTCQNPLIPLPRCLRDMSRPRLQSSASEGASSWTRWFCVNSWRYLNLQG